MGRVASCTYDNMGMVVVCVRQQDRKSAERSMCADGPATRTRLVGLRMLSRIVVKVKKFRLQGITPCHAASGFKPWSCDHGEQPTTSNSASTGCADNNHDYYRVQDPRSSPNMFRPTRTSRHTSRHDSCHCDCDQSGPSKLTTLQ